MIAPRTINCEECKDILSLINAINCKIYEASLKAYVNITYGLNLSIDNSLIFDLLTYKEILTRKYVNPTWSCTITWDKLASRVRMLTAGCNSCVIDELIYVFFTTTSTTSSSTSTTTSTTTATLSYIYTFVSLNCGTCSPFGAGSLNNAEPLVFDKYYFHPVLGVPILIDGFIGNGTNPTDFVSASTQQDNCVDIIC